MIWHIVLRIEKLSGIESTLPDPIPRVPPVTIATGRFCDAIFSLDVNSDLRVVMVKCNYLAS